jgi:hypothetical protein
MARITLDVMAWAAWEKFFRTGSKLSEVAWGTGSEKSVQSDISLGRPFLFPPADPFPLQREKQNAWDAI